MKILSCNYQPHALGLQTSERGAFLVFKKGSNN